VSLTPIYDDLLREFEGIILASEAAEAVQAAADTPDTAAQTTVEATPDAPVAGELDGPAAG
jgi:hypothetical protein